MSSFILALLALLPAVVLMIYIYKKDRIEKEPKGLLAGLFLLGCVSVIPAVILELLAQGILNATGIPDDSVLYKFLEYFFGVALVEEGCKLFFVYIVTRKSKHFNCLFDGVVYAVFVSLGFAVTENLFYVFENGIGVALLRMVTSIPGHCFFGIIMGYFYGRWFLNHKANQLESYLYQYRLIAPGQRNFKSGRWMLAALMAPTAVHGFYDFSLSLESAVFILAFFAFLIALYVLCFTGVRRMSRTDNLTSFIYMDMVLRRHPEAVPFVSQIPEFAPFFYGWQQPFVQPMGQQPMQAQPMNPQPPVQQNNDRNFR